MHRSTRRRRKAYTLVVPATGVLTMLALAITMLVVALTDVELRFDFGSDDGAQVAAVEDAN